MSFPEEKCFISVQSCLYKALCSSFLSPRDFVYSFITPRCIHQLIWLSENSHFLQDAVVYFTVENGSQKLRWFNGRLPFQSSSVIFCSYIHGHSTDSL